MIFELVAGWTAYRMHTPKWAMAPTSGAGARGILFPSQVCSSGTNLVLYTEVLGPDDAIDVCDPEEALPRTQLRYHY